jgi:hypothetical protein
MNTIKARRINSDIKFPTKARAHAFSVPFSLRNAFYFSYPLTRDSTPAKPKTVQIGLQLLQFSSLSTSCASSSSLKTLGVLNVGSQPFQSPNLSKPVT